jgi:hypothetical protein
MTLTRITNFKNRKKAKAQKEKSNFLLLNNNESAFDTVHNFGFEKPRNRIEK